MIIQTTPFMDLADMTPALPFSRQSTTKTTNTLAGVDLSSWLSWGCYGLGFGVALRLAPDMAADLTAGGVGLIVIAGAVAAFFAAVLTIQHQMNVSLRNTSFGAPQKLVDDGIFAVSRNPMYVAFLLPVASIAYYSPIAAVAAATLYVVAMTGLVIAVEEETLEANFGKRFGQYCQRTPRWLVW